MGFDLDFAGLWAAHASSWSNMFVLDLSVFEKILRPIVVYAALVVGLRIFGKRELAQINPFDAVVLMSLANTVQNAIIGDDTSLIGGLIGALSLLSINYLVVRFLFRHRRLDQWIEGKPVTLILQGKPIAAALAKELINRSDLLAMLHRQGFSRIEEIERCDLEPGGGVSILPREPLKAERYQAKLLERLDQIESQLAALREQLAKARE